MIRFYLDGNEISASRAKAVFAEYCARHGHPIGADTDAADMWQAKARSEEARDWIENVCECQLEIMLEDD